MPRSYSHTPEDLAKIKEWLGQGETATEIARRLGKPIRTISGIRLRVERQGWGKEFERAERACGRKLTPENHFNKEKGDNSHYGGSLETPRYPLVSESGSKGYSGSPKRAPDPDHLGRLIKKDLPDTILVIPDLQAPYHHKDALAFLSMVSQRYSPDCVVCIGDELDLGFLSRFDKYPEIDAPIRELEEGIEFMGKLFKLFPEAYALTSNHVHGRISSARKAGRLPPQMVTDFRYLVSAPKTWEWYEEVHLGKYLFRHGDKQRSLTKAVLLENTPDKYGKHLSIVHGHIHTEHGVKAVVRVGDDDFFAAYTGCLIDVRSKAFSHSAFPQTKLGCLVIVKGVPHRIPLRLDSEGRWTGEL